MGSESSSLNSESQKACPNVTVDQMAQLLTRETIWESDLNRKLMRGSKYNRVYSVDGVDRVPGFITAYFPEPLNYGGEPYYCPNGWRRYSLDTGLTRGAFEQKYKEWPVAYHGTSLKAAAAIIMEGFKACNHQACFIDASDKAVYLTPSIKYAGHPRYAKVEKVGELYVQVALQVRVKKTAIMRKPGTVEQTFSINSCVDPNFENNDELEWIFVWNNDRNILPDDGIIIYGIMARITTTDPKDTTENHWWEESRIRLRWDNY